MAADERRLRELLRAARRDEALPDGLHARLLALAATAADGGEAAALPRLPAVPLPPALRGRLLAIPQQAQAARPPLPDHLRSSGWTVAASYVVAALILMAVGDPILWGRRHLDELWRDVGGTLPAATRPLAGLADDLRGELGSLRRVVRSRVELETTAGRVWAERALATVARRTASGVAAFDEALTAGPSDPSPTLQRPLAGDEPAPRPSKETDHDR